MLNIWPQSKFIDLSNSKNDYNFVLNVGSRRPVLLPEVTAFLRRFREIFSVHGVPVTQVSRLIPRFKLTLPQFCDDFQLASLIGIAHQRAVSMLFNVNEEWLIRGEDSPQPFLLLDSRIDGWIEEIGRRKAQGKHLELVVCRSVGKEIEVESDQYGALLLRQAIEQIGDMPVFRYYPVLTLQSWRNPKQRFFALRAMLAAFELRIAMTGVTVPVRKLEAFHQKKIFAAELLQSDYGRQWVPEEYVVPRTFADTRGNNWYESLICQCRTDGTMQRIFDAVVQHDFPHKSTFEEWLEDFSCQSGN